MSQVRRAVGMASVFFGIGALLRAEPLPGRESDLVLPSLSDSIAAVITSPVDAEKTLLTAGQAVRIGADGSVQWTYSLYESQGGLSQIAAFPDGTVFATSVQGYFFPYPPGTMRASVIRLETSGPSPSPPSASLSGDGEPLPFPNPIIGVTPGGVAVDPLNDRVYTIHQRMQLDFLTFASVFDVKVNAYDPSLNLVAQRDHTFEFPGSSAQLSGVFVDSTSFVWVAGVEYPPAPLPRRLFVERYPPNLAGPPIVHRRTLDATFGGIIRAALDPRGGLVVGGERDGSENSDYFRRVSSEGFSASFREPGFAGGPMAVDAEGSLYIAGHEPIGGLPALVKINSSDTQAWGASFVTLASDRRIDALWSPSTGTVDVAGTVDVSFPGSDQAFVSRYRRGAGASGRLVAISDLARTAEVDTDLASPLVVEARDAAGAPQGNVVVNFSISSAPAGAVGQQLVSPDHQTATLSGRAQTGFLLGDIPLEYGVTASCPSCDPLGSSVSFQICGQLPVTVYRQNQPLDQNGAGWINDILDRHPQNKTVGQRGCALTAFTMLLNIFRNRYGLTYPDLDSDTELTPGTVNSFLKNDATYGFDQEGGLRFDWAAHYRTNDKVVLDRKQNVSSFFPASSLKTALEALDESLAQGNPALLWLPSGSDAGHYVTVIARCGNQYVFADPYNRYPAINTIDYSAEGHRIKGVRTFKRGH